MSIYWFAELGELNELEVSTEGKLALIIITDVFIAPYSATDN